jgi:DNA repair protein RadC
MSRQRIHDIPQQDRPRERLLRASPAVLSDAELVGIFINTGLPGENAVQLAQRLLIEQKGLRGLSRCSPTALKQMKGLGAAKAATLAAAFEIGRRTASETLKEQPLTEHSQIYDLMHQELQALNHEEMHVILLNKKYCFMHRECLFKGGLDQTLATPREILKLALIHSAYAFVLVHNHPSGDPQSSPADRAFTRKLRDIAESMDILFYDHVIIGHPSADRSKAYFSFREKGMMYEDKDSKKSP